MVLSDGSSRKPVQPVILNTVFPWPFSIHFLPLPLLVTIWFSTPTFIPCALQSWLHPWIQNWACNLCTSCSRGLSSCFRDECGTQSWSMGKMENWCSHSHIVPWGITGLRIETTKMEQSQEISERDPIYL